MSVLFQFVRRTWSWESFRSGRDRYAPAPSASNRSADVQPFVSRRAPEDRRTSSIETPIRPIDSVGERRSYTTLVELRQFLSSLERDSNLTVVIEFNHAFSFHLSSLIRRDATSPGARLILIAESGRLPGLETIGDLAGGGLGWEEIVLERHAAAAVNDARRTLRVGERLIVFAPA